jgi:peroxiredoxin
VLTGDDIIGTIRRARLMSLDGATSRAWTATEARVGLLELAVLLAWGGIVLALWLGYQLVTRYGRLLLRVEGLERHLGELEGFTLHRPEQPATDVDPSTWTDHAWSEPAEVQQIGLPVGTVLHDFELPDLDGRQHLRSGWLGQRLLLIFVSPACPHSRALLADLAALQSAAAAGRPALLLVSTGPADENRRLVEAAGLTVTILLQEEMEVGALFEAERTPTAYLVDEDGRTACPLLAGRAAILGLAASSLVDDNTVPPLDPPSPALIEASTTPGPDNGAHYQGGLDLGSVAPDFRLPGLDAREVALGIYRGQRLLLVFTDPVCPPCDELAPAVERLHRSAAGPAVVVIARGDEAANRAWATRHGLTVPVGLQPRWDVSRQYGMLATPIGYLVDARGAIAAPVALGAEAILDLARREGFES